jgi:hypothetical protein
MISRTGKFDKFKEVGKDLFKLERTVSKKLV